jgi:hypothetical protein
MNAAPTTDLLPSTISQAQFNDYSTKWIELVKPGSDTNLEPLFLDAKQNRIAFVSFPATSIVSLVSTPGVRYVKARFIAVPDGLEGHHFSIALYAADNEQRLSGYYVADPYWAGAEQTADYSAPAAHLGSDLGDQTPHALAAEWIKNWNNPEQAITSELFTAADGEVLQGYNFVIGDFVSPLFQDQQYSFDQLAVRLILGVHKYYAANGEATRTAGLVVRLHNTVSGEPTSDNPIFDMPTPCPPTH